MSTVFRVVKNTNYTTLSNYHFKDKRLSWKAKGLLSTMLSLPDDWNYTIEGLSRLSADGIKATNSGLLELERYGYLERKQARSDNGRFGLAEYYVYEQPIDNENAMLEEHKEKEEIPLCQKEQTVGNMPFSPPYPKRQTEKRTAEKGRQLNTNKSNTNKLNPSSTEDEMQLKKSLHMQEAEKKYSKELAHAIYHEILKRDANFIKLLDARLFMKICQSIVEMQQREPIRMLPNLINTYLDNIALGIKATNGIHRARDSGILCRKYDFDILEKKLLSN